MTSDLLDIMRARLAEAESAAHRLREAIAVIDGGNGNAAAPRRRESTKKSETPLPEPTKVVPLGKLISALKAEPGQSASRLSKDSSGNQQAILALLKEAEIAGTVRREGERRGTVWFVVTADESKAAAKAADEDEVARKAAEIEARTKKAPARKRAPRVRKPKAEATSTPAKDAPAAAISKEVSEPNTEIAENDSSAEPATTPAS